MKIKTKNRAAHNSNGRNGILRDYGGDEQYLIVKTIAVLLSSLLLSVSASVTGFTAIPLGTAFAAVLPPFLSAAAVTGTIGGIIATGEVSIRLADIISIIAVAAVKTAADKALSKAFGAQGTGLLACVAYTVSGLSIAVITGFTVPIAAAAVFRGLLCGGAAFVAALAFKRLKKDGAVRFSAENRLVYSIVIVLIISASSGLTLIDGYISIGRIIGVFTVLSAAYLYGVGGGAAAAAMSLFAFMLSSPDVGRSSVILGVAAVAAALFGEMFFRNKFAVAVGFTVTSLCALIVCGIPAGTLPLVCDIFAGAVIYVAVPERIFAKFFGAGGAGKEPSEAFFSAKSAFFSELITETSQNFGKVSRLLNNQAENTKNNDSEKADNVHYEMNVFKDLFEGYFTPKRNFDSAFSRKIAAAAGDKESSFCGGKLKNGAFFCEIISPRELRADKLETISKHLENLTFREFDKPEISRAGHFSRAVFCEKAPFELNTGAFELPLGALMNGDTNVSFSDGFGNDYVLISDGMGSGIRAAIESRMTVSLLQKFIRAGVSETAAAGFVNFLLQAKSDEEMLSTVDLLIFSRFTGEAELYKMGAAKTYARIGGIIREYSGKSLPAGILRDPGADKITFSMGGGDALLMLTDGITDENSGKCREILSTKAINPKTAARRVVEESENEGRQDDKTAIFIEVKAVKSYDFV